MLSKVKRKQKPEGWDLIEGKKAFVKRVFVDVLSV